MCAERLRADGLGEPIDGSVTPWEVYITIVDRKPPVSFILAAKVLHVSRSIKYQQVLDIIQKTVAALETPVPVTGAAHPYGIGTFVCALIFDEQCWA